MAFAFLFVPPFTAHHLSYGTVSAHSHNDNNDIK